MRRGSRLLVGVLVGAALLPACSWTFDEDAPDLPLVGNPPSLSTLAKINNGPVYGSAIVRGSDGGYWIALEEETKKLRLVRLTAPSAEQTLEGDQFVIAWRSFFVWKNGAPPEDPMMPRPASLHLISAGDEPGQAITFDFPLGIGQVLIGGADDVFAYVPPKGVAVNYEIVRKADGHRRAVPFPGGPSSTGLTAAFFSGDAEYFFDRGACEEGCLTDPDDADRGGLERRSLVAHATREERDVSLGLLPRRLYLYEPSVSRRQFITCGSDGVRVVPVIESEAHPFRVLDETACASDVLLLQRVKQAEGADRVELFYEIGGEIRRVPIDGSAPPVRVFEHGVERVLAVYDPTLIVYSQDPSDRYIYGVGDGWIGDWRFMERGRSVELSADKKRVRFLENAARSGGIGNLSAADLNGPVERLARNVYQFDELQDGRVLVAGNHAFRGTQNRVVLIDEQRREARWVVDQASRYSFIPGSTDLLVDIVTGASSSDLVRVPLPPPDPETP